MDVRVLKYFMEVVEKGNITKAAASLHVTQPTLSRQLMDLEEEVGTKLFIRGKRKIQLTDVGYEYHQYVKEIVRMLDKANSIAEIHQAETVGVLSIGCVESIATKYLMDQVEVFHRKYPRVQFEFYNGFSDDIKSRIDANQLDLGILIEPVEAAKYESVKLSVVDRWGVVVSVTHPLAGYDAVTIDQVIKESLILTSRDIVMNEMVKWLDIRKEELNLFGVHNLLTNSLPLIRKGLAITITIEGAYTIRETDGCVFVPFAEKRLSSHVIAWKKLREKSKLATLFLDQIKESEDL